MNQEIVQEVMEQQAGEMTFTDQLIRVVALGALGVLALTVVLIIIALILPKVEYALIWDPMCDKALKWCAYVFMGFCGVGLLCIFWKAIRIPTAAAVGVYLLLFLATVVGFKCYEKFVFMQHKNDAPKVRMCEVTKHEFEIEKRTITDRDRDGYVLSEREVSKARYYMTLKFDDEEKALEFDQDHHLPFYNKVKLGDRAQAKCVYANGMMFIVGLDVLEN